MTKRAKKDRDGLHRRPNTPVGIYYFYFRGADGRLRERLTGTAIYREGVRTVAAGANPMAMKRGIEKAVNVVCGNIDPKTGERGKGELDKLSKPVTGDMIAQVGSKRRSAP